jgi:hypothetical protein
MKCVKEVVSGKITRIKDSEASTKVTSGKYNYCSKSEWKGTIQKPKLTTD